MFGSDILEVFIGLTFVYCLLSVVCSTLRENIEVILRTRAVQLESGLRELLQDPDGTGWVSKLYNHPVIYGLYRGNYDPGKLKLRQLPSYIPACSFAVALLDIAQSEPSTNPSNPTALHSPASAAGLRVGIEKIENLPVQRALSLALERANGDLDKAQSYLESWFNSSMERVSGRYRSHTQIWIFALAFALSIALNANTIDIANHLYRAKAERELIVAQAKSTGETGLAKDSSLQQQMAEVQALDMNLPLGWNAPPPSWQRGEDNRHVVIWWARALLGWLMTTCAITLGAPFWFDLLNKLVTIRSTLKPEQKSKADGTTTEAVKSQ